ncbi:537_t:CDS:2 [Funneliformis mosseae]|uniref:537_t:CDS:1 n=1 Tax=Funneliformis mosseae TaxID=27381 RepID=A0A9N8WM46_FUNMO|nr:537_t:CDS:2 [Funneliformis mosseae]
MTVKKLLKIAFFKSSALQKYPGCYKEPLVTVWTAYTKQPISTITIWWNLKKVGFTSCIPHKKPAMIEVHCQACLKWTHTYKNWEEKK